MKRRIHRTTISISADLRKRMDAAGEAVNWSAVAAQAFEDKLLDLEKAKRQRSNGVFKPDGFYGRFRFD